MADVTANGQIEGLRRKPGPSDKISGARWYLEGLSEAADYTVTRGYRA